MSYIAPKGIILLCRNVPLDRTHTNTALFKNADQQFTCFHNYTNTDTRFDNQYYTRVTKNTIRVSALADNLIDCNYLMFNNGSTLDPNNYYKDKWYYAFIDKVEYINENVTEITYTIDVIQSFLFDIQIKSAFVQREHTIYDYYFWNIKSDFMPKDAEYSYNKLEMKNLTTHEQQAIEDGLIYGGIIMAKPLPPSYIMNYGIEHTTTAPYWRWKTERHAIRVDEKTAYVPKNPYSYKSVILIENEPTYQDEEPIQPTDNEDFAPSHITNNAFIYIGFKINGGNALLDNIQSLTFKQLLTDIDSGCMADEYFKHGSDTTLDSSDILATFTYPAILSDKSSFHTDLPYGSLATSKETSVGMNTAFTFNLTDNTTETYTPKNKKCYNYPYNCIFTTNAQGTNNEYKYEDFIKVEENDDYKSDSKFLINATCFPSSSLYCVPLNYQNREANYDCAFAVDNFPTPSYINDLYVQWWNDNKNQMNLTSMFAKLSAIIGSLVGTNGLLGSMGYGKFAPDSPGYANEQKLGGGMALGGITTILKQNAVKNDMKNQMSGQVNNSQSGYICSLLLNRILFYQKQLKPEYIKIVDEYFEQYGYNTEEIKIPNVFNALELNAFDNTIRPCWNFIQCNNVITKKCDMPDDYKQEFLRILDNGIRFWNCFNNNYLNKIGDYSQNNAMPKKG